MNFEKNKSNELDTKDICEQIAQDFYPNKNLTLKKLQQTIPYKYSKKRQESSRVNPTLKIQKTKRTFPFNVFNQQTLERILKFIQIIEQKNLPGKIKINQEIELFRERINKSFFNILLSEENPYIAIAQTLNENYEILKNEYKIELDYRVTLEFHDNAFFMDTLALPHHTIENVINFILDIEKKVRFEERKEQMNKHHPEKKELTFNHFLDVTRTTNGILESILFYWNHWPTHLKKTLTPFLNEDDLLVATLSALLHDYTEDKYLRHDEIIIILNKWGFTDELMQAKIITNIETLNHHNFKDENNNIQYKKYLKSILKHPITSIIKFSDILSNFRSPIPLNEDDHFINGNFSDHPKVEKYKQYFIFLKLILKQDLAGVIPIRFIDEIQENNRHVPSFANHPIWDEFRAKIKNFEANVAAA